MSPPLAVLLPGLDGTGDLFAPFIAAAPVGFSLECRALPSDRPRGYHELADWLSTRLPPGPFAVIAESFSGPLALLLADRCPRIVAVVLCASFVDPPLPSLFALTPQFVWNRSPPASVLSVFLTGGDRALAESVRRAMASVSADVIAGRVAAALRVDVKAELARFTRPLLCLQAKQDRIIRAGRAAKISALKPSAQLVEMQAPHLLLQTLPAEAWSDIQPFLERAAERPQSEL